MPPQNQQQNTQALAQRGNGNSPAPQSTGALADIVSADLEAALFEKVVVGGDLMKLQPAERVKYYVYRCKSVGLDPITKPFDYLFLNGKLQLYATKTATEQYSQKYQLSYEIVSRKADKDFGVYEVEVVVSSPDGARKVPNIAAVPIKGMNPTDYSNAVMKCVTKAMRRATLAYGGLGMIDESELDTMDGYRRVAVDEHGNVIEMPDEPERQQRGCIVEDRPRSTPGVRTPTTPAQRAHNALPEGTKLPESANQGASVVAEVVTKAEAAIAEAQPVIDQAKETLAKVEPKQPVGAPTEEVKQPESEPEPATESATVEDEAEFKKRLGAARTQMGKAYRAHTGFEFSGSLENCERFRDWTNRALPVDPPTRSLVSFTIDEIEEVLRSHDAVPDLIKTAREAWKAAHDGVVWNWTTVRKDIAEAIGLDLPTSERMVTAPEWLAIVAHLEADVAAESASEAAASDDGDPDVQDAEFRTETHAGDEHHGPFKDE